MSLPPKNDQLTKIRLPTLPEVGELPTPTWADDTVTLGTVLKGRYQLEKQVGAGGMGMVFKALDLEQQRIAGEEHFVAVKLLRPDFRDHPDAMRALYEEVRKTRELTHPNIVSVYDCQLDSDYAFMTMQFLEGKPLQELLDDEFARGMPWERAKVIIEGMARGLAYAHDRGVIHCDFKPSNVFVTLAGTAKILDFGISRAARGTRKGRFDPGVLGALTSAYASPEMIHAWRTNDATLACAPDVRDDVFAFGCVIFELLTGQHVFAGRNAEEAQQSGWTYPGVPGLSRHQNRTLAGALAFERGLRTSSIEQVIDGLLKKPQLNKGAIAAVAAVLVAVPAGFLVWKWLHTPPPPPPPTYKVSVRVHDLKGKGLALANNGSDALEPQENGVATFGTALPSGALFHVAVLASGTGQTCTPGRNATGAIVDTDVTIDIYCKDATSVERPKPPECPGDTLVWLNPPNIYHLEGQPFFGNTHFGKYACLRDAVAHGAHPYLQDESSTPGLVQSEDAPLRVTAVEMRDSLGTNTYFGSCPIRVSFTVSVRKTGGAGKVSLEAFVADRPQSTHLGMAFDAGDQERQRVVNWFVSGRGEHLLTQQFTVESPFGSPNGPIKRFRITCEN